MLDRTTDPTTPHTSNLTRGLSSSIYLFVYVFDGTGSQLQHMGSSIFLRACGHSNSSCGLWGQFPDQGLNPGPLHWECRVPALDHQGSPGRVPGTGFSGSRHPPEVARPIGVGNGNSQGKPAIRTGISAGNFSLARKPS